MLAYHFRLRIHTEDHSPHHPIWMPGTSPESAQLELSSNFSTCFSH